MTTAKYVCKLKNCFKQFADLDSLETHATKCSKLHFCIRSLHKTPEELSLLSFAEYETYKKQCDKIYNSCTPCNRQKQKRYTILVRGVKKTNKKFGNSTDPFFHKLSEQQCLQAAQYYACQRCFYCNIPECGGIDRPCHTGPYSAYNAVPCCSECNFMKGPLTAYEFLTHCRTIANKTGNLRYSTCSIDTRKFKGNRLMFLKHQAKTRNVEITLQPSDMLIYDNPETTCYYCGVSRKNTLLGVDRLDSTRGYYPDNCVPACPSCNYMKRDTPCDVFLNNVKKIYEWTLKNQLFDGVFEQNLEQVSTTIHQSANPHICEVSKIATLSIFHGAVRSARNRHEIPLITSQDIFVTNVLGMYHADENCASQLGGGIYQKDSVENLQTYVPCSACVLTKCSFVLERFIMVRNQREQEREKKRQQQPANPKRKKKRQRYVEFSDEKKERYRIQRRKRYHELRKQERSQVYF